LFGAVWYAEFVVRRFVLLLGLAASGLLVAGASADTFKLVNGETITGDVLQTTADDQGVRIKVSDSDYTTVKWANFSQEDLKKFSSNQKLEPYVVPFIDIPPHSRAKRPDIAVKEPPRLERPAQQSLLGALCSSSLGLLILLSLYSANIFAGYEVAMFRGQTPALVAGLSAIPVLGLAAPIVFLAIPGKSKTSAEAAPAAPVIGHAPAPERSEEINPMLGEGVRRPTGLKVSHTEDADTQKPDVPETLVYQRGQYTFNRRFIETKFAGFFGVVRRDAERDLVLVINSARGLYVGQRISRISANDLHLQVQRGHASEEIMIPFQEIKEIRLQHKDAPA
jgi:hypothetical protein